MQKGTNNKLKEVEEKSMSKLREVEIHMTLLQKEKEKNWEEWHRFEGEKCKIASVRPEVMKTHSATTSTK